jgi:hypothetical protein
MASVNNSPLGHAHIVLSEPDMCSSENVFDFNDSGMQGFIELNELDDGVNNDNLEKNGLGLNGLNERDVCLYNPHINSSGVENINKELNELNVIFSDNALDSLSFKEVHNGRGFDVNNPGLEATDNELNELNVCLYHNKTLCDCCKCNKNNCDSSAFSYDFISDDDVNLADYIFF